MKILISNDDGIFAKGLRTLVREMCYEHELTVVAPDRERSATSHALTLHDPIRLTETDIGLPVKAAFAVSGTPSDCVKIAMNSVLSEKPDLIISGINHGPNLGTDVLYSGTVSAAMEGCINGVPSIAVSLVNGYLEDADFTEAAQFIKHFISQALLEALPVITLYNVNIPATTPEGIMGVRLTRLGVRTYTDTYEKRVDPRNQTYYWLAGEIIEDSGSGEPDMDVETVRQGYISVSPIHADMTNTTFLENYQTRFNDDMQQQFGQNHQRKELPNRNQVKFLLGPSDMIQ